MIMKKVLLILVIALLVCAFTAGCSKSDADRIVGTWEYRVTNANATAYLSCVFHKDGTGSSKQIHASGIVPSNFQYRFDEVGNLVISAEYMYDVVAEYAFNEDYTVLTLTVNDKIYEFKKAEN